MADAPSLRRLGGGRWQTQDGRFEIEPQSGTWVVVDTEQKDDLGLPLVRGPFRSLAAAREAIAEAREEALSVSPLADAVEAANKRPSTRPRKTEPARPARGARRKPEEPAWLAKLDEAQRRRARTLLKRLQEAGVSEAATLVRADLVDDRPALARHALQTRIDALLASTPDRDALAPAIVEALVSGEDASLGVGWRLTDTLGRPIRGLSTDRR